MREKVRRMESRTAKLKKLKSQVQNDFCFCTFSVFVSKREMSDTFNVSIFCGGRVNDESDE